MLSKFAGSLNMAFCRTCVIRGHCIECSVQMFLFFLHNHKSYLLLSVCLIGHNLSRSCQGGACNVLPVLFDYRCKRKAGICVISGEEVFLLTN